MICAHSEQSLPAGIKAQTRVFLLFVWQRLSQATACKYQINFDEYQHYYVERTRLHYNYMDYRNLSAMSSTQEKTIRTEFRKTENALTIDT